MSFVLVSNGQPLSFLQKIIKTRKPSTSLPRLYPMSKAYLNNADVAYSNKAYLLFSSLRLH